MPIFTPGQNETEDLDLAAALIRMDIPLNAKCPFKRFELSGKDRPRWVFFFESESKCGNFQTEDLIRVWGDRDWMEAHPEHPWAYLWGGAQFRRELIKIVKNAAPLVECEKRGQVGMLSANAPDWMQKKFFSRLGRVRTRRS